MAYLSKNIRYFFFLAEENPDGNCAFCANITFASRIPQWVRICEKLCKEIDRESRKCLMFEQFIHLSTVTEGSGCARAHCRALGTKQ